MTTTLETTLVNIFETSFVPTKPIEDVVACLFAKMADNFGSFNINEDIDKMSALEVCRISHKVNAVICRYIKANYSKEILKKYFDASTAFINAEYINREHNDAHNSVIISHKEHKAFNEVIRLLVGENNSSSKQFRIRKLSLM